MPQMYSFGRASYIQSSSLEHIAASSMPHYKGNNPEHMPVETRVYERASSFLDSTFYAQKLTTYFTQKHKDYHATDGFLKLYRPATQCIGDAEHVESFVKEAFTKTTGEELPANIIIRVLNKTDMQRVHEQNGCLWSDTIQGFAFHKPKQIFVKEGDLDRVMLVIGHEIGHVLTPAINNALDEEAKAFAFEIAWMQTIVKHNIANLKDNINLNFMPANNGLHDVAFNFVKTLVRKGRKAIEVYGEIVERVVTIVPEV